MTDSGKILAACLTDLDFELWVDPDEWAGLDLATQTARIVYAHTLWARQHYEVDNRSEQEKLTENIQDEHLKSLVWRAWLALPDWERKVLNALQVKFVETALPAGALARCFTQSIIEKGISPLPTIELDPSKYTGDDDDTLWTIFHELVHASYRTTDIHKHFKGRAVQADLYEHFETFCYELGDQWLKLEQAQREKSHSDNGAAAATAAQNSLKTD